MMPERAPVDRSIDILTWLAEHPARSYGVREVARDLSMSPSTIHRIFRLYEERGFLTATQDGRYGIGLELYRVCLALVGQVSFFSIARPSLEHLAEQCGEAVVLGAYNRQRLRMMFVDAVQAAHPLRYMIELNKWVPIHTGASGLAILSFIPEADRRRLYTSRLEPLTARTLISPLELEKAAAETRALGYACTRGQRLVGAVGIAAPVFDTDREVIGSVCITIPEQRFREDMLESLSSAVMSACSTITADISRSGYLAK